MRNTIGYGLALSLFLAGPAASDDERPRGIRAGALLIVPSFSIEQAFDTNVFLSAASPTETYSVTAEPRLRIQSDWNRHALVLDAGLAAGFFTHDSDDNFIDFDVSLGGELDITRAARLSATAAFLRGHERRGTVDVPGLAAEPTTFAEATLDLRADIAFNALRLSPYAGVTLSDFDDTPLLGGGISNQDDRDRLQFEVGLEAGYRVSRSIEGFIRTGYARTDYDAPRDDTGIQRNSDAITVETGLRVRLNRLLEGRAGAGVIHRRVTDPALNDVTAAFADIGLVWDPTPRLSFSLDVDREVRETTLPSAAAVTTTEANLSVSYELLRTVTLRGSGALGQLSFDGTARTDRLFGAGLVVDWDLTRQITLSGGYDLDLRRSRTPGLGYTAHQIFLDATYQF